MSTKPQLSFLTLLLMISFASVNAVLFTPALPAISNFFMISDSATELTITWFLIGYAIGQLLYGPIANRYGRKPALYSGIILQIVSSLLCILSGAIHDYSLLVLGRFLLALGSGVGLKMTFTLVNETYQPIIASQKLSYLMIGFAITPGVSIMIGGLLSTHLGWISTFYASAIYGVILLLLTTRLPETQTQLDPNALKFQHLIKAYKAQFKNIQVVSGGLLMGAASCFIYIFAAIAPFVAMNIMGMNASTYGTTNLIPPIGLVLGSLISAQVIKKYLLTSVIQIGIFITFIGSMLMCILLYLKCSAIVALFIPLTVCYLGLSLIFANASTFAMSNTTDKAHGAAVMSFINMGLVTGVVLSVGFVPLNRFLLPAVYIGICFLMVALLSNMKKSVSEPL